jgi:carbonic anhydrase/acetyltransferase-like protein (isoleucine patch superfamily)
VEDGAFVGMGATLLDGVVVETGAFVAAGSLVTENTRIPAGQVFLFSSLESFSKLGGLEKLFFIFI